MRRRRALAGLALAALAGPALAAQGPSAWTACQVVHGVLVVPARAAGLTGVFVLDAATPTSAIDATQASQAGLDVGEAAVPLQFGGRRWARVRMSIAPLDDRTRTLPTPITGILGADVLDRRVLEVWPEPCRFRLSRRPAPAGQALAVLPIVRRGGLPHVLAGVSDGASARRGLMRIATGEAMDARLSPDAARVEGAARGAKDPSAPLRALSLGEVLVEDPQGAIQANAAPGVLGTIGEPVWARYGFRLDLRRDRLTLFAPQTKKTRRGSPGGS
jgi:hypothetical protein